MKRKTMTLVLCLLAALALVSVGFASWVISADSEFTEGGSIVVDEVHDKRLTVETDVTEDTKFVFGAPKTKEFTGTPWLSNDGEEEVLEIVINVTIKKDSTNNISAENLHVTAEFTSDAFEVKYNEKSLLVKDGEPPISAVTASEDGNTFKCSVTLKVNWGEAFGGKNPYNYYNGLSKKDNAENAKATLDYFNKNVNNKTFTLKLTIAQN